MSETTTAITGGTALLGPRLDPEDDAVVVIDGRTIVAAGPRSSTPVPDGADEIDASHLTLLPGFIDAHVHIGLADPHEVVAGGVTAVRDLGWPAGEIFELAERSRDPDFDGPAIVAAGPMLTAPGGYPTRASWAPPGTGREVRSPADARAAVAERVSAGATVVKIALNPPAGPVLDHDTLDAIVGAAHDRGLRVTGHVFGLDQLHRSLDAGVDEVAHMLMSEEEIPEDTIAAMVAQGMVVVPTLSIRFGRDLATAVDNLRRFVTAGGRVIYGTDLGNEGPRPGIENNEIAAMTDAGISPRAIIASATVDAASYLGLTNKGELSPGRDADLVAVRGDPASDTGSLDEIAFVFRMGRQIDG